MIYIQLSRLIQHCDFTHSPPPSPGLAVFALGEGVLTLATFASFSVVPCAGCATGAARLAARAGVAMGRGASPGRLASLGSCQFFGVQVRLHKIGCRQSIDKNQDGYEVLMLTNNKNTQMPVSVGNLTITSTLPYVKFTIRSSLSQVAWSCMLITGCHSFQWL